MTLVSHLISQGPAALPLSQAWKAPGASATEHASEAGSRRVSTPTIWLKHFQPNPLLYTPRASPFLPTSSWRGPAPLNSSDQWRGRPFESLLSIADDTLAGWHYYEPRNRSIAELMSQRLWMTWQPGRFVDIENHHHHHRYYNNNNNNITRVLMCDGDPVLAATLTTCSLPDDGPVTSSCSSAAAAAPLLGGAASLGAHGGSRGLTGRKETHLGLGDPFAGLLSGRQLFSVSSSGALRWKLSLASALTTF
ncbi:unnamed protein product [Pleuronectes platessa]|uniref:Uncharacterized protein n=1 Tax=Pleuronectes platessa TaxID=8262 RepID=A0A9N7TQC0_PLEPL|nr:unnamed protein product [Pleuronectes platessa]